MSVQGALVTGIPGLKSETWGTLRVSRVESIWVARGSGFEFEPFSAQGSRAPSSKASASIGHFGQLLGRHVARSRAWFGARCKCILYRYMSATKEAVEEHGENDAADQDVDLVLLDCKTVDAKSDTHDWGRDQKQNT
jgi:hypothetical protein